METRIPGGPHIKTRGIVALGFQTNITHFLCCLRDRGHGGLSPEDLPPLSPSTSPPPHPTGAAKSKCQSRRRRCIPLRGQLVVATEGSVACLRIRLFIHDQPIQLQIYILGAKQKATLGNLWSLKSLYMMTPLSRCSPCFEDDCSAYLQHTAHFSPLWVICSWAWFTMCCIWNLLLSHAVWWGVGGPVAAHGGAAPDPSVQVIPAPALPLQAYKELSCLGHFYERDLNMPVLSGLDSVLRLLESQSHWWLSDFSLLFFFFFTLLS